MSGERPTLLTVEELAKLIRVSPGAVRSMHKRQELPRPIKIGRRLRWNLADVLDWLRAPSSLEQRR